MKEAAAAAEHNEKGGREEGGNGHSTISPSDEKQEIYTNKPIKLSTGQCTSRFCTALHHSSHPDN